MGSIDSRRLHLVEQFGQLADALAADSGWLVDLLCGVSSIATAVDEVDKAVRCLRTYDSELALLSGRVPLGERVAVSLPFNNPLYSLILYAFGSMLGGSQVIVRPSSLTAVEVHAVFDRYSSHFSDLPIAVSDQSGRGFVAEAANDVECEVLIFTGSFESLLSVGASFPVGKTLIYCGSGISPFVVCEDAATVAPLEQIVQLAIRSRLYNSGQDCLCAERFYVHHSLIGEFGDLLVDELACEVGLFGDRRADVVPLLGGVADRLHALLQDSDEKEWLLRADSEGSVFPPQVVQVPIGSALLRAEKFGPLFTLAAFDSSADIDRELDFPYRFGATVCGSYRSSVLETYPHRAFYEDAASVIELESVDAHVPFGGRFRSGFVRRANARRDGPILFSVESSTPV